MIDKLKNENKTTKFFLGLAVLTLLMILSLSWNGFYNGGDDYNFLIELRQNGILNNCIRGYFDWDGRMLTLGALVQAFCLLNLPIELVILIWSLCFLGSGLLLFSIINFELNLSIPKQKIILYSILLSLIFWFGSFQHLSETVYWGTGGVYSFHLLIGAIWVYWFLLLQKSKPTLTHKIIFIFYSFIAGASTQNLSICLITLVFLNTIIEFIQNGKSINKLNATILLFLIFGILYISLAPGNFLRIKEVYRIEMPNKNLIYYLKNNIKTVFKFGYWSLTLILFSFIFSLFIFLKDNTLQKIKLPILYIKQKWFWINFIVYTKWFWVAISSLIPFVYIPELISKRTSIYFMFFITIFCVSFTINIFKNSIKINNFNIRFYKLKPNILFIFILSIISIFTIYNFVKATTLKKEITKRELIFQSSKNKIVRIKLLDSSINSKIFKFNDYVENGTETIEWIKESQEKYYQIKIVVEK